MRFDFARDFNFLKILRTPCTLTHVRRGLELIRSPVYLELLRAELVRSVKMIRKFCAGGIIESCHRRIVQIPGGKICAHQVPRSGLVRSGPFQSAFRSACRACTESGSVGLSGAGCVAQPLSNSSEVKTAIHALLRIFTGTFCRLIRRMSSDISGQWPVASGQWSVGSCQLAVVSWRFSGGSGQSSVGGSQFSVGSWKLSSSRFSDRPAYISFPLTLTLALTLSFVLTLLLKRARVSRRSLA